MGSPKIIKKYSTEYRVNKSKYGSHIFAKSFKEAELLVEERGIGEKILGCQVSVTDGYGRKVPHELENPTFDDLSDFEFVYELPKIIHTACFLVFIAASSRKMNIYDSVGDQGIIHELVHLLNGSGRDTRSIRRVRGQFVALQNKIPGYLKTKIKQ